MDKNLLDDWNKTDKISINLDFLEKCSKLNKILEKIYNPELYINPIASHNRNVQRGRSR